MEINLFMCYLSLSYDGLLCSFINFFIYTNNERLKSVFSWLSSTFVKSEGEMPKYTIFFL